MVHEQGERDIEEDLKLILSDYTHSGVKAGLSTAPFVGGPLAEFFAVVIAPPLEKRRDAWLIEIYRRLKLLEGTVEGFKIESLATNESFISTLFQATNVAIRTHQKEKLEALTNAVTNSVLAPTIDENYQLIFLNLIDRYTPWHLILLHFLADPQAHGERQGIEYSQWLGGGLGTVIEFVFPNLKEKQHLYNQIIKDMISDGLLNDGAYLQGILTPSGMLASRITDVGKQFLEFITPQQNIT
jgi:hypothetical protein